MKKLITLTLILLGFAPWVSAQNGLNFDGTNDVVQTNYAGVLGSANRTFEAWVYVSANAPASNLAIVDYGVNAAGDRNTFAVDGNRGLRFISGGTNANISTAANNVPVGQWVHVAFVLDNGTGYLYINGSQKGTGSLTSVSTPTNAQNVKVGERVLGGSIPFHGSIDEVRIWDVARTPSEILANMNAELCGQQPNLQLYLKFNEGTAGGTNTGITSTADGSGNGYIGTLSNFNLTGTSSNWVTGSGLIASSTTSSIQQSACGSFSLTPNSTVYTTSGIYTEVLSGANAAGCDSIVTIDLTITTNTTSIDEQSACGSYTWIDGNTYTSNDINATFTLTNAAGCDSIITLSLTLNNNTGIDEQTACSSYTWIDGNTYTANNNSATFTLTNAAGCDSVVTLDLTIINSSTNTDVQSACDSYTWIDGNTYTANNNNATFTLTNSAGCDSIITLDLTINTLTTTVTQDSSLLTADEMGATYQWVECPALTPISGATNQSFTPSVSGEYAVIVSNNQCSDTSNCYYVILSNTVKNTFENSLEIFPNPTDGKFSIDLGVQYKSTTITIFDLTGKQILSNTYDNNQLLNVNLEAPSGVYFLTIEAEGKKAVVKLIKK